MRKISFLSVLITLTVFPVMAQELPEPKDNSYCEGDGCDAYLPVAGHVLRYEDVKGEKRLNSVLGGLAGGILGADIADLTGAIAFGALGAVTGYRESDKKRWEEDQRAYEAGYNAGIDMFYDPSHRLPLNPHWMQAGPPAKEKK